MKTKFLLRALSLFLALCSIISMFPLSAFATYEHISDHCIDENCNTCDSFLVGEGITVALLDSGVQSYPVHAVVDLVGEEEVSSHGDEMAAVLLENAPGVTLMDVRVLDADGVGDYADVREGIIWAANHGAQIIVMSFAGLENSRILREAVEYAAEMGVVMVAAAGNDVKDTATFPAAYAQVLSVGALNEQGQITPGSNSGAYVDLYVEAQGGTSHAAQIVAASIAELMQSRPEATAREICAELSELEEKTALMNETDEHGIVYASACVFHKWGGYSTTRSPSCTTTGQKVRYCTKCGKAQSATIAKLGHTARSYYTPIGYASCLSDGVKVKYCVRCSYVFERVTLNALGHSWSGYTTTKSATCTASGQKEKICTRCGTKSYSTIAALGHYQNSYPSVTVPSTCTSKGYSIYRCARCETDMHTQHFAAQGHSYDDYYTVESPTCTKTGLKVKTCSRCSANSTCTIPKLAHSYYTEEERRESGSGCVVRYYTYKKCRTCETIFGETERVTVEHKIDFRTYKEATCREAEKIEVYCKDCKVRTNIIDGDPAMGHNEKKIVVTEANCVSEGKIGYICVRCHEILRTKIIPANGVHDFVTEIIEPGSCHVDGEGVKKCRYCPLEEEYTITSGWIRNKHEGEGYFCKKDYNGSQELYCRKCQLFVEFRGISGSSTDHNFTTTRTYVYLNSRETEEFIDRLETAGNIVAVGAAIADVLGGGGIVSITVDTAFLFTIEHVKAVAKSGQGIVVELVYESMSGTQSCMIYSQ